MTDYFQSFVQLVIFLALPDDQCWSLPLTRLFLNHLKLSLPLYPELVQLLLG